MSYSRPGTRQVNALVAAPKPVSTRIVGGGDSVRVNPNGRFIDNTNASQAGRNAAQGFEQMAAFLESFGQVAQPVGESIVMSNANREVGELLKTHPNIGKLYGESDPDTRALINSLNPITQDLFVRAHYAQSSTAYKEMLASSALADSRLTTAAAKNDPDAYAAAWADVRQKALDGSGLSGLPTSVLGAVSGELGQIDGAVRGALAKAQNTDKQQASNIVLAEGLVSQIEQTGMQLTQLRDMPGSTPAQAKDLVQTVQVAFAQDVETKRENGVQTPRQHLNSLVRGVGARLQQMVALGQYEEAQGLLDTIQALALGDAVMVGPDGKLNYWSQPIAMGKDKTTTIVGWLNSQRNTVNQLYLQNEQQRGERLVVDLARRAAQGDETARAELTGLLDQLTSPDAIKGALSFFGSAERFGEGGPITAQELDLYQETLNPNRDKEELSARIRASGLRAERQLRLLQANAQGGDGDAANASVNNARILSESNGITGEAANELAARAADALNQQGFNVPDGLANAYQDELRVSAYRKTIEQARAAVDAGTPLTQKEVNDLYQSNIENEKKRIIDQLQDGQTPRSLNVSQVVTQDLNAIRQNVLDGKRGTQIFPPSLIQIATDRGLPTTGNAGFKALQSLMISRMNAALDVNGQPEFPRAGAVLQQTVKDAEKQREKNGGMPERANRGFYESNTGDNAGGGLSRPSDRQNEKKDEGPQAFILDGLEQLAGALLPGGAPASAATTTEPAGVLNGDQIEALARMWTGQEKPTLQTPGLPQVEANTQVQSVPTAIGNDRHPFFVAIGIAEGTRTPDGGYTQNYYGHRDPGDGNLNRGTVSGGRGNSLGPKQVDRQWIGILNRTSVQVSSYLKAAGLQPGTQGWNRVMFNVLDLRVQSPEAMQDFVRKINKLRTQGFSVEAIAKARADSFYRPDGTLNAPGFKNNYRKLFADQRSRAGVWDYRRRF